MQLQSTYQDLVRLRADITEFSKKHPGIAMLLSSRINEFFQRNAIRLNIIDEKYTALIKKHVIHGDNGMPVKIQEDGKPAAWKYRSEEDKEEYNREYQALMQTQITVQI